MLKSCTSQYSAVVEDIPFRESCTTMKNNISIKNILNPLDIYSSLFITLIFS